MRNPETLGDPAPVPRAPAPALGAADDVGLRSRKAYRHDDYAEMADFNAYTASHEDLFDFFRRFIPETVYTPHDPSFIYVKVRPSTYIKVERDEEDTPWVLSGNRRAEAIVAEVGEDVDPFQPEDIYFIDEIRSEGNLAVYGRPRLAAEIRSHSFTVHSLKDKPIRSTFVDLCA